MVGVVGSSPIAPTKNKNGTFRCRLPFAPAVQPPYRYFGSHSVMPGQMYMNTMQMITMIM
jgi:hypothetical protein